MPILVALMASALLHVSMLLSDGWALPSMNEVEELDVVLAPPPAPKASAGTVVPLAKSPAPAPKPLKKNTPTPPAPAVDAPSTVASGPAAASESAPNESSAPGAVPAHEIPTVAPSAPSAPAPVVLTDALARLPAKASWRYTVTRGEGGLLIGEAIYGWEHDGREYKATSRTETIGIAALFVSAQVTQESVGELNATGLHPTSYRHVQPKRTDSAELDRVRGVVLSNQREMPLRDTAARVQDLLSMYYQLGLLLATLDPVPAEIALPLATGRKL